LIAIDQQHQLGKNAIEIIELIRLTPENNLVAPHGNSGVEGFGNLAQMAVTLPQQLQGIDAADGDATLGLMRIQKRSPPFKSERQAAPLRPGT
jgi:hypothetical protein